MASVGFAFAHTDISFALSPVCFISTTLDVDVDVEEELKEEELEEEELEEEVGLLDSAGRFNPLSLFNLSAKDFANTSCFAFLSAVAPFLFQTCHQGFLPTAESLTP